MAHTHDVIDQYVEGGGRVTVVDLDISSLDRDGEEDLHAERFGHHLPREVQVIGRQGGDRHQVNWDFQNEQLLITKANGNVETAGADIGPFRLRIKGPR